MPAYEMVYVLRPTIPDEDVEQAVARINGVITSRGGSIEHVDVWGRRRLAYPLQDYREGIYVLTNFASPPQATKDIESQLRINDDVMRHLVIRRDET